ncbi:MAG TPA: SMC-Scp complex subunit ScpB [Armatimonadota bacterium]|nr:SMC-Scp complex subunit ScpB [Armatimonadota bacterium]
MTDQLPEAHSPTQAQEQTETEAGAERAEKLAALEAVLFMAAEPISAAELAEILEVTPGQAQQLADELAEHYTGRGIQITRVAGAYQVCTRPQYGPFVAKLHKPERFRLSRAALETLAIVAYKQPITRPEIESIRGVNSDSPVDTLAQYELIRDAGRKDAPGRPVLYRTTDNFLGHFGLDSVEDLPRIDAIPVDEAAARAEATQSLGPPREDEELTSEPGEQASAPEAEAQQHPPEGESGETREQSI